MNADEKPQPPVDLTPLRDAPLRFASRKLRKDLAQAQGRSFSQVPVTNTDDPVEIVREMGKALRAFTEDVRTRSTPRWAMEKELLRDLRRGKLEAWGVQTAPRQKRVLERISSYYFIDGTINWNRNGVANYGAKYTSVGVRRTKAYEAQKGDAPKAAGLKAQPPGVGEARKRGPESSRAEIIRTFEDMMKSGQLKKAWTLKACWREMRPVLAENAKVFPKERGLTYPTIARHLHEHLKSKA